MSVQSARDFLKGIGTDLKALKEHLTAAPDDEARQQLLQAAGFDFTIDEFKQAGRELAKAAGKELTPEELQTVVGGSGRSVGLCWNHHCK